MRDWRKEETREPGFVLKLEPTGSHGGREREEAECLLEELMALPVVERLDRLEDERFQSPRLFDLLLERGRSALLQETVRACELLEAAVELGLWLDGREDFDPQDRDAGLARALCLVGTAARLRGDQEQADQALVRAGRFVFDPLARAFFARSFALLRWDQGRNEEAAAFLHHALGRFGESGSSGEQAACNALLGLLALEEEETVRAEVYLRQANRGLGAGVDPWLGAQATLGRAVCLALSGEAEKAKAARRKAWELYREVKSEDALVSVYWLEGRVAVAVGEVEDGLNLLESVREKQIASGWLTEATLVSLDVGLVLAREGRTGEVRRLAEGLTSFEPSPGYDLARRTLGCFVDDAVAGRLDRERWAVAGPSLRLAFRLGGVRPRPVPFA
jgi:tetratricopeptide (TPR) repeat protein